MQILKRMVAALCLVAAISAVAAAQDKSLYERLGGVDAITAVTDAFIANVVADARINGKFAKSDPKRLRLHLIEQLCAATGGPCEYTGQDMKTTHKNMKVTEGEFNALVEDLVAALDKFNVPEKEKNELLGILGPLKAQIVEVNGTATGTPLPANFKPAKPLPAAQTGAGPKMKTMKSSKGMGGKGKSGKI
jgi:hemoglobin